MKKNILIILFFLFSLYVKGQNLDTFIVISEKVDTNYTKKHGFYLLKTDMPDGRWRINYNNGQLYSEYILSSKLLEGYVIYYWPNGNIMCIENNLHGKLTGQRYLFHSNGEIAAVTFWKIGEQVGNWKFYNEKGKLEKIISGKKVQ